MKPAMKIPFALFTAGILTLLLLSSCGAQTKKQPDMKETTMTYTMPAEDTPHEGTWLIWPHKYTDGMQYQRDLEGIWIQMTQALVPGENVHIIAYDTTERERIRQLLADKGLDMSKINFVIAPSDDVWVRDTGPLFVFDTNNTLTIANFAFDGWGKKVPFKNDDNIPIEVAQQTGIPIVDIPSLVLEGGAIEIDGKGTLMGALSSVASENRNSDLSIEQVEQYLSRYLGVNNFIWLEGVINEDITDAHIDGTARFLDDTTILTVSRNDFEQLYENIDMADYETLLTAKNAEGNPYKIVELPLTHEVLEGEDYYGSYLNYYLGNEVVLVPIYDDVNDAQALDIIANLYPSRKVVPIDANNLVVYGGMIHCVTQQQPQSK